MKVFITPSTHWDREWVMTFGQYRIRLVGLIDRLLEIMNKRPDYHFMLDGQAVALEDYLAIKPENRDVIARLLAEGRLTAGPWYVLADQFLQGGEATVRNLLYGMETVRYLGGRPMMVGYVPDSFGSIATMPMILKEAGISYALFGRGRPYWNDDLPDIEFMWQSPDGSEVITANHWYMNGLFLSYPDIWTDIFANPYPDMDVAYDAFMRDIANQKVAAMAMYYSVGIDHMEPRGSLAETVDCINLKQDAYELVFGSVEDYFRVVEADNGKLKTYAGEMRGDDNDTICHGGTLTTVAAIKQKNDAAERLLSREIEPLCVFAGYASGEDYPKGILADLWKNLLKNHAHDSVCGCNIDPVNHDVLNRFDYILETGEYLHKDILHNFAAQVDTRHLNKDAVALVVINPLGSRHTGSVRRLVRVPKRFNCEDCTLVDKDGIPIPAVIKHVVDRRKDLESVYMTNQLIAQVMSKVVSDDTPDSDVFTMLEIDFVAEDMPETGYQTFWLIPGGKKPHNSSIAVTANGMESEILAVSFNANGTFDITDKRNGHCFTGLNYFLDREEIGDAYCHIEFEEPDERSTLGSNVTWRLSKHEAHYAEFVAEFEFDLPACVDARARSNKKQAIPIDISVRLTAGLEYLNIALNIDNTCEDHLLRAVFDTNLRTTKSYAFDHYNIIERPAAPSNRAWRGTPFSEFVAISDGDYGLCIAAKGLPSYEVTDCENGARLSIELLRSSGCLGPMAGSNHPTTVTQSQGAHRFEYAIALFDGGDVTRCLDIGTNYRNGLLIDADLQHEGNLPPYGSLISMSHTGECRPYISGLKQAEDGSGIILRLWNPVAKQGVALEGLLKFAKIYRCTLLEDVVEEVKTNEILLPGFGVVTLKLQTRS